MKYFSFKILILCIILPSVIYIVTVLSLERHFKAKYVEEIEDIYTGDTRPLFDGSITLKDAINKNIDFYLKKKALVAWGVNVNITVVTKHGTLLYPSIFEEEASFLPADPMQVAADNYQLMTEGPVINIDVKLEHNALLSNIILAFYILASLFVLYYYYRSGSKKAMQEDLEKSKEIDRLQELEEVYTDRLKSMEQDRKILSSKLAKTRTEIEDEKIRASKNEDEMIEEIVGLEEEIGENLTLQDEQQEIIDGLKEKIKRFEIERLKDEKKKIKDSDAVRKRFKALYKDAIFNERAISGFIDLSEDIKIKGEEIIHQLNADPSLVPIKRKVFGKKSRETVLEILFAYKGRIYFRKLKDNRVEILTIGTKNTQAKDLEFLNNL